MMRKGRRKSATVYLAAAVILTCYLAQTIDCYRLKKTERREGRKEANAAKTIGVQEGKILFGRVFAKGSGLESQVIDGTQKSSNTSVEDEAAYQADFAGWPKGQTQDTSSREALWKRMAPSLQCGGDQLKFRAVGPGASQFAVEQGNAPPMPLSQVPPTCGYSMHKNSLALVMLVPYDGCNMVQEGGSYVLPMRWQGIPVSLWCPKPAAPAPTTAAPQNPVPQTPRYPPSYPQMPQVLLMPRSNKQDVANRKLPPPYFFPAHLPYPQYPPVVPEPTTTTTTTKEPEMPKFPQYPSFVPPFYPFFQPPLPVTTAAPTTTKSTTTKEPEMPKFPQYPSYFPPFYPFFQPPFPVTTAAPTTTTAAPTTTKSTTTTTTTAKPAAIGPPPLFPFPFYQPFFPPVPWPYTGPLPATAKPTTTQSTTTKPTTKPQSPQFPPYMPFFPPYPPFFPPPFPPYPQYPTPKPEMTTTMPTTTTATEKTDHPLTPSPSDNHPHFHPHVHFPFPFVPYPPPQV